MLKGIVSEGFSFHNELKGEYLAKIKRRVH